MGYLDNAGLQYLWGKLKEKFAPKSHSHDDRYYTESEMDGKLNSKSNTNHTHDASTLINALGAGTAAPTDPDYIITQWVGGGTSNTTWIRRPMSSIWNYIKGKTDGVYQPKGSYAASGHTHDDRYYTETEMNAKLDGKSNTGHTHDDRYYTETEIDTKLNGKAPISHTHTKSQITDFPTSMPASDVSAWAKAPTKPTYTKAEVGLGNVDNTADKDKNVKYATSAGLATNAQCLNNDDKYMKFHWSGQDGQPTWLWGGNDSGDMYVYNPSNFNVNYAESARNGIYSSGGNIWGDEGYIRFNDGIQICWGTSTSGSSSGSFTFPQRFVYQSCIMISGTGAYRYAFYVTKSDNTGFNYYRDGAGSTVSPQYVAFGRWK